MAIIYVARSKAATKWGADVGLGKTLFLIGCADDAEAALALLKDGPLGETDWELVQTADAGELDEAAVIARLAKREKQVDPKFVDFHLPHRGVLQASPSGAFYVGGQTSSRASFHSSEVGGSALPNFDPSKWAYRVVSSAFLT